MRRATLCPLTIVLGLLMASLALPTESRGAGPSELEKALDAFSSFRLTESGRHVKDVHLPVGHLTVSISDGTVTPLRAKDGSIAGVYITGTGGWTYKAEVASERAVLETNKARIAGGIRTTSDSASDYFNKLVVLFSEPLWADVWDPRAGAPGADEPPPAGAAADCESILTQARWSVGTPEIDFRLTQARLNGGGKYVYAEFFGGSARAGYLLDEVATRSESIFGFREFPTYKARFLQTLASHTILMPPGKQAMWASYRHARIDVATPDNKRGTIATDLDLHVTGPTDGRLLEFELLNSRNPDSPAWDTDVNRLEVTRVLDGEGRDLPFAHRYHRLLVEIPPLQTGESDIKIRVETSGEVFLDWKGHHDDSFFALRGPWWPWPTEWRSNQHLSFDLKVRTKAPWRSVASGNETALRAGKEWIETESHADRSSFFIYVLGGKYVTHEETVDGRKIRIYAYAMARKNVIENMPNLAGAFIRFYSSVLGPMQADELDIVEVPEFGFGIAPFGMALITSEAFKPQHDANHDVYDPRDEFKNFIVRGINARVAHEIAHQWFGNKAIPATDEDDWVSETLAEYWAGLAMGAMAGGKTDIKGFQKMLWDWRGEAGNCEATGPITSVNFTGGEQWFRDRYCLLYHRGPLVVHMLRTLIGDERFAASSKLFLDRAALGPATTDDFAKAVTDTVHTDFGWFFEDWIRKGGTPDLKVDYQTVDVGGGKRLRGTVTESGSGGFKRLYVPFIVDTGGRNEIRLVFVDKPQTPFDVPLPAGARDIKVDPGKNSLVKYR